MGDISNWLKSRKKLKKITRRAAIKFAGEINRAGGGIGTVAHNKNIDTMRGFFKAGTPRKATQYKNKSIEEAKAWRKTK